MKTFFLPGAAILCLFAVSCQNLETPSIREDSRSSEILFRTKGLEAEVSTKATAVTSLSSFYVAAATGTAGTADQYAWGGAQAEFTGSGTYSGGKYWPYSDPGYHFYAANSSMTLTKNSAAVIDVKSNATDIVCAYLANPTHKATNTLTFNHIFARLGEVNVSSNASGYTVSSLSIKITPNTGGKYNILNGNGKSDQSGWSSLTAGSATAIASALGKTANDLYLVPGSYTLSATYTLTKGDYSHSFDKSASVSLEKGKINKISATLPAPGSGDEAGEILFEVSVTNWGESSQSINF